MAAKHISADSGAFAERVLLPGDPLRARYIAENYLQNASLVTDVRNMLGYTGEYNGVRLSVMGSGMGIPSASIYCTELIKEFNVKEIIRIGSCGAVSAAVGMRDVVIAIGASTDSNVNRLRFKGCDLAATADFGLLEQAVAAARAANCRFHVGNIFSTDLFYAPGSEMFDVMVKYNILGVEMEAAGIYAVAAEFGAKALAMCTVSDHHRSGAAMTADERQQSLHDMVQLALNMSNS